MPEYIIRFFKGLALNAHAHWLVVLLALPASHWLTGPPDMTDRPMARSEGRITWVGHPKSGTEVLLQTDASTQRQERLAIQGARSTVFDVGLIRTDQRLRVERYGALVANCWVGEKQVCFSKCTSDLQCKQTQEARNLLFLCWAIGLTVFGYFFTLVWVACGGQISAKRKTPGDSR
jgi:hypothetical protein